MSEELLKDGRYQLLEKIAEGGQGTTWDALDKREGRRVALKRFQIRGAKSWKDVELAEREANVLRTLSHPALPAYIDHFEENGALHLVMEKIEGEPLSHVAKRGGLGKEDVVRFLRDAAGVLEYLHGRSPPVIHRDINPKNVIRRPDGSYAIVDFGAVRDRLRPEGGSTVVGTFGYMAPEQFQGRALPASDVYAVGATALRLLTGVEPEELPHRGLAIDVRAAVGQSGDFTLTRALERMLEPDPDRRAKSLGPLVAELDQAAERTSRRRTEAGFRSNVREQADAFSRRERRRAEREAVRQWERTRRRHRRGRGVHGPPLVFALLGINVAIVMVGLALGVVIPIVLTLLSLVFGSALRTAARNVERAGRHAGESLRSARNYLLHGDTWEPEPVRVEPDEREPAPPPRVRVTDDEPIETEGTKVAEDRTSSRR